MRFGLGQSAPREEDKRFLRGQGRYTDDFNLPGQACSYMLRSPHAHALIRSTDTEAARQAPGVLAIYTGDDIAAAGLGDLPCYIAKIAPLKRPDGQPIFVPPHPALAQGKVAFAGDCVAFVVAETQHQARDAAELIAIDYEPLTANVDTRAAPGTPAIWDGCPDNICYRTELGDRAVTDAAFAKAHHVTRIALSMQRV
jgi:carbon-monoxide dehydrogenase large subunit